MELETQRTTVRHVGLLDKFNDQLQAHGVSMNTAIVTLY